MPTTKSHCNTCSVETNHEILHAERSEWRNEEYGVTGGEAYETLKCCGCETIRLRKRSWCSEYEEEEIVYYPPSVARRPPAWLSDLRKELEPGEESIEKLLDEIYAALQNNLARLATMGIRALLEHVMISKAGDKGNFAANIAEFERLGHISRKQRERLEAVLEAGHAATHRSYAPRTDDLKTTIEIAEHIIESIYMHDSKIAELRLRVPPRNPT